MTPEDTVRFILTNLPSRASGRQLIAVAGPPASGKTTIAEQLAATLPDAAYVPMDGFHLDNSILETRGLRDRKGAPETFDADGFVNIVERLYAGHDVIAPMFDRARDISVAGALHVPATVKTVVVEGNYLLFDKAPWRNLRPLWAYAIWLDVPLALLETRLVDRWRSFGFSETDARNKALLNDIPNANTVLEHALAADLAIDSAGTASG